MKLHGGSPKIDFSHGAIDWGRLLKKPSRLVQSSALRILKISYIDTVRSRLHLSICAVSLW